MMDKKTKEGNKTKEEKPAEEFDLKKEIMDYLLMFLVVGAVVFVVNGIILINARIPSESMQNTIMVHDRVFGYRFAYKSKDPERFDIVIFRFPDDERTLFIKRIIGLPGDTVTISDGKVYINGSDEPLDDSFCPEKPEGDYGPYVVPENCYFMMGDNRNCSNDSRFWVNKFVARDKILGKAVFRYWPLTRMGKVS